MRPRPFALALAAGLLAVVPAAGLAAPASAQIAEITTPFPNVTVEPGATVRYELTAEAAQTAIAELEVAGLPDGWSAVLRGGGNVVSAVTASPDSPGKVTLEVKVPPTASAQSYPVSVVQRVGGAVVGTLPLTVKVDGEVDNAISLTTDFPQLKGAPTDTFTYNLTVTNNTPAAQTFTFTPTAPQGWSVTASAASETRSPTVTVEPGQTGRARVEARPPASVTAGAYPIQVAVATATGQEGRIELGAEVSGQAALALAAADERLNVSGRAGGTIEKVFTVSNTGTADLTDVSFSSSPPTDWKVTFEPSTLARVAAGGVAEVRVIMEPAGRAIAGDYSVGLTARAGSLSDDQEVRVAVKTSRTWGLIGALVIVAALGGLGLVFRRYGRR